MNIHTHFMARCKRVSVACLALLMLVTMATAGNASAATRPSSPPAEDGQRDFDWEFGTWRTDVQILANPLSDEEDEWLTFKGTSVVRPLVDRKANIVEFDVSGPTGRIQAINLRLFEPQANRWSLTFANLRNGLLTPSVYGGFHGKVGRFFGDDELDGRPIKVRFIIVRLTRDKARFEQAFSDDGGKTWETNWIAVDQRVKG